MRLTSDLVIIIAGVREIGYIQAWEAALRLASQFWKIYDQDYFMPGWNLLN